MAIDILFLIMATFGFYFGYTFGLMRLALVLFSFLFATIAAMSFTPMTSNIIQETFGVTSVFMPFIAFGVTLLIVLMLARIVTKLIEETLTSERFDILSRLIGGILMALWFTLLYSVLVIFFGKSGVLPLVFNEQVAVLPDAGTVQLGVPPKTLQVGPSDTLMMTLPKEPIPYSFYRKEDRKTGISLKLGFVPLGGESYQAYVNNSGRSWNIFPGDTVYMVANRQMVVQDQKQVLCFCDSTFLVYLEGRAMVFDCRDEVLAAKSATSIFYPYIEIIPRRGNQLMNGLRPLISDFVEYMDVAIERVEQGPPTTIDTYDGQENRPVIAPAEEDVAPVEERPTDTIIVSDPIPDIDIDVNIDAKDTIVVYEG